MPDLSGKTALVTGASRGIGRATAKELSRCGAHIIAHYGSSEAQAQSLVGEIEQAGGTAELVQADLLPADGAFRLAQEVRERTGDDLDILISNAGVMNWYGIEDETIDAFDRQMAINVRAPFFLIQQLTPALKDGASIVMLSSITVRHNFGNPSYAATKGAISALVVSLAASFGPSGVRVNAVAPAGVETELAADLHLEEVRQYAMGLQCLKRICQPDDIASAIAFLASDEARWITGTTVATDGGMKI